MQATVETRHVPEVQKQTQVDWFLWRLLTTWHALRGKKTEWAKFFGEQEEKLRVCDQRHPDCRPLPSSKQPRFLVKPVPVMIAKPAVQPDPATGQIRRPVTFPPSSPLPPPLLQPRLLAKRTMMTTPKGVMTRSRSRCTNRHPPLTRKH